MSFTNPTSILFNTEGYELAVSSSQVLTGTSPGILFAGSGSDGSVRFVQVSPEGAVFVTGSLGVNVTSVGQGSKGTADQSWYMVLTDGTSSAALGSSQVSPLYVTGGVNVDNIVSIDGTVTASVTGTVNLDRGNDNINPLWITGSSEVYGTVNVSQPVEISGSVAVTFNQNPTATVTQVTASVTTVTLANANANRRALMIYHDGTKTLYVKLGSGANMSNFSVKLVSAGYFEVPGNYTGIVTGIWDNNGGAGTPQALVTEIVE